jgi:hypothetical protein
LRMVWVKILDGRKFGLKILGSDRLKVVSGHLHSEKKKRHTTRLKVVYGVTNMASPDS